MSFLKQIIEDACAGSVSSGSVAGVRGCLFGGGPISRTTAQLANPKRVKYIKFNQKVPKRKNESTLTSIVNQFIAEEEFNSLDVKSKLDYAEKNVDRNKNSTVFGLEDKDGGTVKVFVASDQAKAFEEALQRELKGDRHREIAEILFELRNKFNIMHVEWPSIPEDEEADMQLQGQGDQQGQDAQGQGDQTAGTEDLPTDTGEDKDDKAGKGDEDLDAMAPPEEDTSGIKSMLDKVIDMLKSDSEARKAESNAKAKEAEAREAEAAARIASMKVKSEEEVMSAENYFKQQQKNKQEAQKLTKLAAYHQAISQQRASFGEQ